MQKKILIILCAIILIVCCYKLFFWSIRDYYYQLKYGAFEVDYKLGIKDRLLYQEDLKKLISKDQLEKIDPNYFSFVGYLEWMRVPTVYPYVINAYSDFEAPTDSIGKGAFLTNASTVDLTQENPDDKGDKAYENDDYGEVIEKNIIAFSFNDKYFIGKTCTEIKNALPTERSVTAYFMFEFAAAKIKHFATYKELMAEADKLNYKRTRFYLDYTKEREGEREYKESERAKYLDKEETELFPFQLFYGRFTGLSVEI
ncbi:MAG: hypothetical protein ABIP51_02445 [Bacteroidia bacterium]